VIYNVEGTTVVLVRRLAAPAWDLNFSQRRFEVTIFRGVTPRNKISSPTFQKNIVSPSSGSKSKPRK
jgi:hypothetical protein